MTTKTARFPEPLALPTVRAVPSTGQDARAIVPRSAALSQAERDSRRTRVPAQPPSETSKHAHGTAARWGTTRRIGLGILGARPTIRAGLPGPITCIPSRYLYGRRGSRGSIRRPPCARNRNLPVAGGSRVSRVHSELTGIRSQAPNLILCGERGTPYEAKPTQSPPIKDLI